MPLTQIVIIIIQTRQSHFQAYAAITLLAPVLCRRCEVESRRVAWPGDWFLAGGGCAGGLL